MTIIRHVTRTVWTDITYEFGEKELKEMKEYLTTEVKDISVLPELTMDLIRKILKGTLMKIILKKRRCVIFSLTSKNPMLVIIHIN